MVSRIRSGDEAKSAEAGETRLRRMTAGDIDAVSALTARAFGGEDEGAVRDRLALAYRKSPALRPDHGLVAERGGQIVAKWQALDLHLRVGHAEVRAAGIHAVVAAPEVDGEGLAWRMVPAGLVVLAELGHDLAVGFAQKGAAYAAIGAATVAADYDWSVDAWTLSHDGGRAFRDATATDLARMVELSSVAQAGRSGSLVRSEALVPWLERAPSTVWIAEDGYLGIRDADDAVEVREAAGTSPSFYRSALAKLREYAESRKTRIVRGHFPPDHPLVEASVRYGARVVAEYPRRGGMMAFVADASTFVPRLAPELSQRLARARGRHAAVDLEVCVREPATSTARLRIGASDNPRAARLTIEAGPGQLAQLVFGHRSPEWIEGLGIAGIGEGGEALTPDEGMGLVRELFPPGTPFMQHTDRW